jgi:hypothetical protein
LKGRLIVIRCVQFGLIVVLAAALADCSKPPASNPGSAPGSGTTPGTGSGTSAANAPAKPVAKANASGDDGLFPYKVGVKWVYKIGFMRPDGKMQDGLLVTTVEGTEVIDGKTYFKVVSDLTEVPPVGKRVFYYREAADGIYRLDADHKELGEVRELPRPLAVGTEWDVQSPNYSMHYRVTGLEKVNVRAGDFDNCFAINGSGSMTQGKELVVVTESTQRAPGVGDVTNLRRMTNMGVTIGYSQELVRKE